MRLNTGQSNNVEDRRGMGGPMAVGGGVGAVVIALIAMFLGVDITGGGGSAAPGAQPGGAPPANDSTTAMVRQVLQSTEQTWGGIFQQAGETYQEPTLVLFRSGVQSACGFAQAAVGPFYCPRDQKVYIDLSFYDELDQRFNAPGKFPEAYVLAHEVGHHVQNLTGVSEQVERAQQAAHSKAEANAYSVQLELQADCYAGVWAFNAQKRGELVLEPGDVEQAITAASAIGDDKLQEQAQGRVVPDSFTHGSSAQRVAWFRRGLESGDMKQCDTFNSRAL